jgi:hypothetical protein
MIYKAENFSTVKMGNTNHSSIAGIGNIYMQIDMDCQLTLKDMRYILDLRLNLLSDDALNKDGFKYYLRIEA